MSVFAAEIRLHLAAGGDDENEVEAGIKVVGLVDPTGRTIAERTEIAMAVTSGGRPKSCWLPNH
ncbi:hypothetical protein [Mesorhizobium sp.]|uniref:hypothetical protein n=1 Tax=Mesorhizobium sp. TaxID=1871066 RepID=UPI000FE64E15|nr:hypothetical protein [Mesorhizobium sp.]RWK11058.1 MAG: hypothetical protein EOR39_12115 [Mesorhizobium sp.]TIQ49655.1 MAG: hypothetical protein E5X47_12775 [Mesorhizobium sp.]TIQ59342.1 MAG: hypothetical protein E5X46_06905 [Mesorhizobium sp.]TJV92094.1 MAG: hypothetical protein E5X52_33945 [Mesorhizobium sp.]